MDEQPVAGFNLTRRECYLKDGRTLPITNLFDRCDDEIHGDYELEDLERFVAGAGDYWVSVNIDHFEPAKLH